jgi:hypothetical protein
VDKLKEALLQYWPWILGAVIGLYIVMRLSKSSTASASPAQASADPVATAAGVQSQQIQTSAAVQSQQIQTSAAVQSQQIQAGMQTTEYVADAQRQVALAQQAGASYIAQLNTLGGIEQTRINSQTTLGVASIGAQTQVDITHTQVAGDVMKANISANVAMYGINADVAKTTLITDVQSIHEYAGVLNAINAPTLASITSATQQNLAVINSITTLTGQKNSLQAGIATTSINADTARILSANDTYASIVQSVAGATGAVSNMMAPAFSPSKVNVPKNTTVSDIGKLAVTYLALA